MTHPAPHPSLPLRTVVIYSAGALVALALGAFVLLASRGSAPVAPAPDPEAVERNLRASEREAREKIKGIWAAYDKAPPDKLRLVLAMTSAKTLAESAPSRARREILDDIGVASRYRMAPIIRPESYATDTGAARWSHLTTHPSACCGQACGATRWRTNSAAWASRRSSARPGASPGLSSRCAAPLGAVPQRSGA